MNIVVAFAALLTAQELDASAVARIETNAGFVPVPGATQTATLTVIGMEASPSVSAILSTRSSRLTLAYSPRIYYRVSDDEQSFDPLLLNRLTLTYTNSIERDLTVDFSVTGSKGQLDYAIATTGTDLSVAPTTDEADVIDITSLIGSAGLTKSFGPSESLEFALRPSYTSPRTSSVAATSQLRTGADVTYSRSFSSRDQLQLAAGTELIDFDTGDTTTSTAGERRIYTARATIRYTHELIRGFEVFGLAGASTTFDNILPLAQAGVDWDIHRRGNWHLATAFSAGVDTFANPLLGTFDRRLVSSFGFTVEYGSRIDILLSGSFFTTLGEPDVDLMPALSGGGVVETVLQGRLPISYRIDDNFTIEVGLRTSLRGPRLAAENFRLAQPEFVGYASVTASIDTRLPGR